MTKISALLAGVAALALLGGTYVAIQMRTDAACAGVAIAGGAIGGPFTLVDQTGAEVTDVDVITKPSLIYFGYTFCPDVCPIDVSRNADAVDILAEDYGLSVKPVFVSLDPKRDTPEVLSEFTDAMHPDMIGLTGSEDQVAAIASAYRAYRNVPDSDDPYYLVDHSAFTYLMMPETGFAEIYRREVAPEAMAESLACFVEAAS